MMAMMGVDDADADDDDDDDAIDDAAAAADDGCVLVVIITVTSTGVSARGGSQQCSYAARATAPTC